MNAIPRFSRLTLRMFVFGCMFLMVAWALIMRHHDPHFVFDINGVPQEDLAVKHPIIFIVATIAAIIGGFALIAAACYRHFCLKLVWHAPRDPSRFNWRGALILGVAVLLILIAFIGQLFHR